MIELAIRNAVFAALRGQDIDRDELDLVFGSFEVTKEIIAGILQGIQQYKDADILGEYDGT